MRCIHCENSKTSVTNSRPQDNNLRVWRRRKCTACSKVFTTNETINDSDITVESTGEPNSAFDIGKLSNSIYSSFAHDQSKGESVSFWIANSVKIELIITRKSQGKTITPSHIIDITHRTLLRFDNIAAVQYAARNQII